MPGQDGSNLDSPALRPVHVAVWCVLSMTILGAFVDPDAMIVHVTGDFGDASVDTAAAGRSARLTP